MNHILKAAVFALVIFIVVCGFVGSIIGVLEYTGVERCTDTFRHPKLLIPTLEQPGLKFSNLETECYRYTEFSGGFVWICDNGHVEYDSTGVKFPTLEIDHDTPTD